MQDVLTPLHTNTEADLSPYIMSPDGSLWAIDRRDPDFEAYLAQQKKSGTAGAGWLQRLFGMPDGK